MSWHCLKLNEAVRAGKILKDFAGFFYFYLQGIVLV